MNESNHKKHGSESRKNIGNFHHNEWAIMGSTCGEINKFFLQINEHLSKNHKVYYIDEDHSISTNYLKIQNKVRTSITSNSFNNQIFVIFPIKIVLKNFVFLTPLN